MFIGRRSGKAVRLDRDSLCTHAVALGMTGSGKTGLCVSLLEETGLAGVPSIIVDPKGDLTNRALLFPELRGEDFAPWVDPAQGHGLAPGQVEADRWRQGLARDGIEPDRLRALEERAPVRIWTPGSSAGAPVSLLRAFDPPPQEVGPETRREQINATARAVLDLAEVRSRGRDPATILVHEIIRHRWDRGQAVTLADLVAAIQHPPVRTVGVVDVETFMPEKERHALAMKINSLAADPALAGWLDGDPLDCASLLAGSTQNVFYTAHLSDEERMFFVSTLLNKITGHLRTMPGSSTLKALLYIDEVQGLLPPVRNPPSKGPLMTLLKQARAFGLGVVLATQNPADLDYKGLTNIGTWFIGRLQADRDKQRLMDGLRSADRTSTEVRGLLSGLEPREFVLHTVRGAPSTFRTRWAMSYLRGPLTLDDIRTLTGRHEPPATAPGPVGAPPMARAWNQSFMGKGQHYSPCLYGQGSVRFVDDKAGIEETESYELLGRLEEDGWTDAVILEDAELLDRAPEGAAFAPLPAGVNAALKTALERSLSDWLYQRARTVWHCPHVPGVYGYDDRAEYKARLAEAAQPLIDADLDQTWQKYEKMARALNRRLRKAEAKARAAKDTARRRKRGALFGLGGLISGLFGGRRRRPETVLTRFASASAADQVQTARADMAEVRAEAEARAQEAAEAMRRVRERWADRLSEVEEKMVRPRRTDVRVSDVRIVWIPDR